jgi:hypothetical protein
MAMPESSSEMFDLIALVGLMLAAWYFCQRLAAALLLRNSTAFCPACYCDCLEIWPRRD